MQESDSHNRPLSATLGEDAKLYRVLDNVLQEEEENRENNDEENEEEENKEDNDEEDEEETGCVGQGVNTVSNGLTGWITLHWSLTEFRLDVQTCGDIQLNLHFISLCLSLL
ncbi:hypothetical protein E2C01_068135 [Portunus trituberculatus]|uniref:Uncharacterized protein n=1 Tax=Portunus trituberculatus TaxID=210409 RepID=A0A5B7HYN2_PORTR|nr:hypothetical protein [Portunus trituberculatus]